MFYIYVKYLLANAELIYLLKYEVAPGNLNSDLKFRFCLPNSFLSVKSKEYKYKGLGSGNWN